MYFPPEGRSFLRTLAVNNERTWFQDNKPAYETSVKKPSKDLLQGIKEQLEVTLGTDLETKQFRINRDLRFSKDKTPYNTHVRFSLWEGGSKKPAETPAFHLSIEPDQLVVGAGCMQMPAPMLTLFRSKLKDEVWAAGFNELLSDLYIKGASASEPELKRVPLGLPTDHPQSEHLRRKGIACWLTLDLGDDQPLHSDDLASEFQKLIPLYETLKSLES